MSLSFHSHDCSGLHLNRSESTKIRYRKNQKIIIKKYKKRNIPLKKGDKVKIIRGQFKKKEGKIEKALLKKSKVYIENIQVTKRDGTKTYYPINPSNVIITELNLTDKKRKKILERKNG